MPASPTKKKKKEKKQSKTAKAQSSAETPSKGEKKNVSEKTPPKTIPFASPLTKALVVKDATTERSSRSSSKKHHKEDNQKPHTALPDDNNSDEVIKFSHDNTTKKRDSNKERRDAKRAKLQAEENEEQRLTSLLFGGGGYDDDNFDTSKSAWKDDEDGYNDKINDGAFDVGAEGDLFEIDTAGVTNMSGEDNDDKNENIVAQNDDKSYDDEQTSDEDEDFNKEKAAWVDEDDADITVSLSSKNAPDRIKKLRSHEMENEVDGADYQRRLRERFVQTASSSARTDWARVDNLDDDNDEDKIDKDGSSMSEDEDDEDVPTASKILSSTAPLVSSTSSKLPPNIISIVRCQDANKSNYNESVVQAVHFHPGTDEDEAPLLLTAGLDKTLRFFKIDGEKNEKVHGIHFPTLPIHSASFLGDTGNVVVSGRRPFFYIYDSIAGKIDKIPRILGREEKSLEKFTTSPDGSLIAFIGNDGYIIIVEAKTKMWVGEFKMNGSARAVTFSSDGKEIFSSGSDGDIYRWDIRSKKCIDRFRNEDGTITSYLSATSRFLAVGAESGVVNMYNNQNYGFSDYTPKPLKSIMNLQTSIDYMKFNHDGQILAMSTRREKDNMKLLHVPTQTVFSNWPTSKTPLGYVCSLDFSPGSKYLAVGNDKGKCLLYKLGHYNE